MEAKTGASELSVSSVTFVGEFFALPSTYRNVRFRLLGESQLSYEESASIMVF